MLSIFCATFSMFSMYRGRFEGNINPPTLIIILYRMYSINYRLTINMHIIIGQLLFIP